jgi:hypothetical protein
VKLHFEQYMTRDRRRIVTQDRCTTMPVVAALFSLSITVAAFAAEESNRVYLLCDETIAKADSSPESRSVVYILDLADHVIYPAARFQERTAVSVTPEEITWERHENKLFPDGRWHRLDNVGKLNRTTGRGEKTLSDTGPDGATISKVTMKCISGKEQF